MKAEASISGAIVIYDAGGDGRLDSKVRLPDGRNARAYRIGPKLWEDVS